jgi:hypothetical protein
LQQLKNKTKPNDSARPCIKINIADFSLNETAAAQSNLYLTNMIFYQQRRQSGKRPFQNQRDGVADRPDIFLPIG